MPPIKEAAAQAAAATGRDAADCLSSAMWLFSSSSNFRCALEVSPLNPLYLACPCSFGMRMPYFGVCLILAHAHALYQPSIVCVQLQDASALYKQWHGAEARHLKKLWDVASDAAQAWAESYKRMRFRAVRTS